MAKKEINVGDQVWMGVDDGVGLEGIVHAKLTGPNGVKLCKMNTSCYSIVGEITVLESSLDKVK